MEAAEAFWILAYVWAFLGSMSFGYFALRFSKPDIRTRVRNYKLGLSGFVGIAIFGASYGISLFSGQYWFFIIPLVFVFCLSGALELSHLISAPKTIRIAMPVVSVSRTASSFFKRQKPTLPATAQQQALAPAAPLPTAKIPPVSKILPVPAAPPTPAIEKPGRQSRYLQHREKEQAPVAALTKEKAQVAAPAKEERIPRYMRRRMEKQGAAPEHMEKFLEQKDTLLQQAKADLTAPKPQTSAEKELEELGGGIDIEKLGKIESLEELGDLGLEKLDEISLETLAGLSETKEIKKEPGFGCPKCGSTKSTIVYCPYCGKGSCSNCATKVDAKNDLVFYGCPHCGKDVIVKKEAKAAAQALSV